jgi:2'-hydroxyisoflavone reductase
MQKILILGGTKFIGRNIVETLSKSNEYELYIFQRGESGAKLFPKIKRIIGNRETDSISQIAEIKWDFVIDCSCYLPDDLERTLQHLPNSVKKYVFISTCSAYDDSSDKSILRNEEAPIYPCTPEQRVEKSLKGYGNKKAECERILQTSAILHVILRPSLTFGPYDYTDRLYYWLYQVKTAKALLLPDTGDMKISITYVKDLVAVVLKSLNIEAASKTYNVMSYPMISIEEIVDCAMNILDKKSNKIISRFTYLIRV